MVRLLAISLALTSFALPALAKQPVTTEPVVSTQETASDQPIVLPQHDVQLIVTRLTIPAGAAFRSMSIPISATVMFCPGV